MTRQEFYPGFAKSKAFYDNEYPPNSTRPWPYDAPIQERAVRELLKKVVDPSSKEYYKSESGDLPNKTIHQIVRIKTTDGHEYLYSKGAVKFYNMYHDPITEVCDAQETYEKPIFLHETKRDEKDGHDKRFTTGIEEKIIQYEIPFTADNVDTMLELKSPKGCTLTVKEELSGRVKQCNDLEMFKNKPFDYILNDQWQTAEERDAALREEELVTGVKKKR